jgi:hypothetical protein
MRNLLSSFASALRTTHIHQPKDKQMKRSIFSGLLLAAATFIGLAATPAFASYTETTIIHNGVTCYRHTSGTFSDGVYPGRGNYYYCGLQVDHEGPAWITAQNIASAYPNSIGTNYLPTTPPGLFPNVPVGYYVFSNCLAELKWNSTTNPTDAQLRAWYSASQGEAGVTDIPTHSVIIYEYACQGTYPNTVINPSVRNTTAHETGHAFDSLYGTPSKNSTYFDHLANYDKAYMAAHDPNYSADMTSYGYYLTKSPTKFWAELFAGQMDSVTQGAGPAPISPIPVLQNYWKCTAFFLQGYLALGAEPTWAWISTNGGSASGCPHT